MKKIKLFIKSIIVIFGVVITFGLLGLVGSSNSIAVGENANRNASLEYENAELNEMKNIYGDFMNEIYPVIMEKKVDFNNMTSDSIQKCLNLVLNLYPDISPIKTVDSIRVSSKYGWRTNPVTGVKHMHTGIDIDMPLGSEIHATMSGVVEEVMTYTKNGYGKYIIVKNSLGFKTMYAHLNKINVKKGQEITKGDIIATLGATGNVTGANLHYEIFQSEERKNPLDSLFMLKQLVKVSSLKENSNENPY